MPRSTTHPSPVVAVAVVLAIVLVAIVAGCADETVGIPERDSRPQTEVEGTTLTRRDPADDGRFLIGVLVARTGPLAGHAQPKRPTHRRQAACTGGCSSRRSTARP